MKFISDEIMMFFLMFYQLLYVYMSYYNDISVSFNRGGAVSIQISNTFGRRGFQFLRVYYFEHNSIDSIYVDFNVQQCIAWSFYDAYV